jgi:hypothetical protein
MKTVERLAPLLAILVLAAIPGPARPSAELRARMAALAADILKNTRGEPVRVGQFSPTGLPDSNVGPGFEALLRQQLEAVKKGSVQAKARYEVKGDYALVKSRTDPNLREIRVTARLIEETGDELKDLRVVARLEGNKTLAEVLQVTAKLPPAGSRIERNQALVKRLEAPAVFIHGPRKTLISSASDSPYAVEVWARPRTSRLPSRPRPASAGQEEGSRKKGLAFVAVRRGELYEVKVTNSSGKDVAVSLTIDGLDVFHFSKDRRPDGRPRYSHFIVGARQTQRIVGWHNTSDPKARDNYLSFLVTGYGQGASSRAGLPSRGKVGVLHVQFAHCRPLPPSARARSGSATGFGPPRAVKDRPVRYEIEPPHDFVTVRYLR